MLDLNEFDAVVIHWSLVIISDHYLAPAFRERIAAFRGLKIQFIQDDYRWVDRMTAMMRSLGIQVLFTLVPEAEIPKIWDQSRLPAVRAVTTLAGYVPDSLVGVVAPPIDQRPIEIGYRGRVLPYEIGRVGQEKVWIGRGVLERAGRYGLRSDIAWMEKDRIYGVRWNEFMRSCRAVLGTESGATITDFDGSLERRVHEYLAQHPRAEFEEVHAAILAPYEGNVRMTIASPRVFEAIAWRTALVQFPGDYSGVIRPWDHYIPLERDFSNLDEVIERVRDTKFLESLTARAYEDVIASGRYSMQTFVRQFDDIVDELADSVRRTGRLRPAITPVPARYWLARVEVAISAPLTYLAQRFGEARARRPTEIVKGCLALVVVLRTSVLRRVLFYWLGHPRLWRKASPRLVLRDLLKVGLVRKAYRGDSDTADPFVVVFHVQDNSVAMRSQSPELPRPEDLGWKAAEAALAARAVRHIIWDHSGAGMQAWFRLPAGKRLAFGSEGGRNRLTGLDPIVETRPSLITDALRPPQSE
jgi:hypothetical protein